MPKSTGKMVGLVDCNNFYASAERLFNPALHKSGIVVLSNNDGCVIARSQEAKDAGIQMGAPAHLIEKELADHGIIAFSSNYTLYDSMSSRVMKVISSFSPTTEFYSIDEAFLDFTGFRYHNLYRHGRLIRATVLRHIGIPVSIGIAPTRTLAKIANRYVKKHRNPTGVYYLDSPAKIAAVLQETPVADIWGIGRQYAALLTKHKIITAWDLSQSPSSWVQRHMSVVGSRLVMELQGVPCAELEIEPPAKKNIGIAKSFGRLLSRKEDVMEALANYTAATAVKLRRQGSCAGSLRVFLETNPFRKHDTQYFRSVHVKLPVASCSTPELIKYATCGLDRIWKDHYNYKKVGILLQDLVPVSNVQLGLYDSQDREKQARAMKILDSINAHYRRKGLLSVAAQGNSKVWRLKQERLSRRFTTRLADVVVLNQQPKAS